MRNHRDFKKTYRANTGLSLSLIISYTCMILLVSGCVYHDPPPEHIELVDLLPVASSTLIINGFDLSSPLLIPYLSGFGEYPYSGTVASASSNVAFIIPPWIDQPLAVAVQARLADENTRNSYIQIFLNDVLTGRMAVTAEPVIKTFKLRKKHFVANINTLTMKTTGKNAGAEIEQIWLLPNHHIPYSDLKHGNNFAGVIWFPENGYWHDAIILPAGSGLWFPVHLPLETAVLKGEFLCDGGGLIDLKMEVVTARPFRSEPPLISRILFKNTPEWLPVEWDVSARSNRFAALRLTNNSDKSVLIRQSRITQ